MGALFCRIYLLSRLGTRGQGLSVPSHRPLAPTRPQVPRRPAAGGRVGSGRAAVQPSSSALTPRDLGEGAQYGSEGLVMLIDSINDGGPHLRAEEPEILRLFHLPEKRPRIYIVSFCSPEGDLTWSAPTRNRSLGEQQLHLKLQEKEAGKSSEGQGRCPCPSGGLTR